MPNRSIVIDSINIIYKLEEIKPEPLLVILEDLVKEANSYVEAIFIPIVIEFTIDVPNLILVDKDVK